MDIDQGKHYSNETVKFEPFNAEPANVGMNLKRQFRTAQTDVRKFDVAFMTSEEVEEKRKELYEKNDGGWRCLACDYTTSSIRSSQIRCHVETHIDGLCYTCDKCSQEFRSRNLVYHHKKKNH